MTFKQIEERLKLKGFTMCYLLHVQQNPGSIVDIFICPSTRLQLSKSKAVGVLLILSVSFMEPTPTQGFPIINGFQGELCELPPDHLPVS